MCWQKKTRSRAEEWMRERKRQQIREREKKRSLWRRSRLSQVHICQPWLSQRINATDNLPNWWANATPLPSSSFPLQSDHNWRALRNCNTRRCQFRAVQIYFAFKKRHILCLPLQPPPSLSLAHSSPCPIPLSYFCCYYYYIIFESVHRSHLCNICVEAMIYGLPKHHDKC